MKSLNKKLSTKLALFSFTAFILAFIFVGVYFYIYLKNDSYKKAQTNIIKVFEKISLDIKRYKNSLSKQSFFLDTDKSIIASIYLINNYEEADNYNDILLDEEKKIILEKLLKRAKFAFNDRLVLYVKDKTLATGVEMVDNHFKLFFSTYVEGKRAYYVSQDESMDYQLNQNQLSYHKLHETFYHDTPLSSPQIIFTIDNQELVITAHHSIFDKNESIAHIEISKIFSQNLLNSYSKENSSDKLFMSTNAKFKNNSCDIDDLNKLIIKEDDRFYTSLVSIDTFDGKLYFVIKHNKAEIFEFLRDSTQNFIAVLTIIALIFMAVMYLFYNFVLIKPLTTLMQKINKIENRNFKNLEKIKTDDELEEISSSIDNLAFSVKDKEERLNYIAIHDSLTNLYNRYYFNIILEKAIKDIKKGKTYIALIFIDIDQFKLINDTLGHDFGDKLLVKSSKRLQNFVDKVGFLARIGGDEFMIVLSQIDINKKDYVISFITNLQELFDEHFIIEDKYIKITFSLGIVLAYNKNKSTNTLYKEADIALYKSKERGRDRFTFYEESFSNQIVEKNSLLNALKKAIESFDEFFLLYQPKISTKDAKTITGVEVLVRWVSKELGFVPPNRFIPIAEESGLIIKLGYFIIKKACEDFLYLQKNRDDIKQVSINLSTIQIQNKNFLQNVKNILSEVKIKPCSIEFEITEGFIINDDEETLKILHTFRDMNIDIAIDDFGTGYSSLSYLQKLPITKLKIDKSFVTNINQNSSLVVINEAMISLAKSFKLVTTAEGVETKEEFEILKNLGVDDIQGYYFAKPMKLEEMVKWKIETEV